MQRAALEHHVPGIHCHGALQRAALQHQRAGILHHAASERGVAGLRVDGAGVGELLRESQPATQVDRALVVDGVGDGRTRKVQRAGVGQRSAVGPGHGIVGRQAQVAAGQVQAAAAAKCAAGQAEGTAYIE